MRAPTVRKLCTQSLSIIFRPPSSNNPIKKPCSSFKAPLPCETQQNFDSDLNLSTRKIHALAPPVEKLGCEGINDEEKEEDALKIPVIHDSFKVDASTIQWAVKRERSKKWMFKDSNDRLTEKLIKKCEETLGATFTVNYFGRLSRDDR